MKFNKKQVHLTVVPLIAYESIVEIIVDNEQFSNQLFFTQTGDQFHYSVLHVLTYRVQLLLTHKSTQISGLSLSYNQIIDYLREEHKCMDCME